MTDARAALASGDPAPALKWVPATSEAEVREAFRRARAALAGGEDARSIAEQWFFETVVRLHRAGEGMPFTGLKPAGEPVDPAIVLADEALASGDVTRLTLDSTTQVRRELETRFAHVLAAKAHRDESVAAGRAYVEAYVAYVHYVEALHALGGEAHTDAHGTL